MQEALQLGPVLSGSSGPSSRPPARTSSRLPPAFEDRTDFVDADRGLVGLLEPCVMKYAGAALRPLEPSGRQTAGATRRHDGRRHG
jgi:hypothetical protein